MRKTIASILLILILSVSACSPKNEGPDGDTHENENPSKTVVGNEDTASSEPTPEPYTDADQPCKPFSIIDQVIIEPAANIPPVSDEDRVYGPEDAVVTFLEYTDFQCPFCAQLEPMLVAVQAAFPEDVRLVFRHWPLSNHDKAIITAQAAEAAKNQGKFFDMKNFVFDHRDDWVNLSVKDFETWIIDQATSLNLNVQQFTNDLHDENITRYLEDAYQEGINLGLQGTPTLLLNGSLYGGRRNVDDFKILVELVKHKEKEFVGCPPTVIQEGKDYTSKIATVKGDITIDLFVDQTPTTVNNFIFLAKKGWYDNNSLLIVDDNFILTGDPSGTRNGGPGYVFMDEISEEITFKEAGMVAMYNFGPGTGTNGSMFFITKNALEVFNGLYTIFGKVIDGMDVVTALTKEDTILSITITES
ncbi:MAG TPA: thioredoxin domain-containing protein [Anaerolineae bacterium]|nr:thioredoxin domain-containing protein [Anaerolineae bacterium]